MNNKTNQSVIRIPTTFDKFFRVWCEFLRPLHHLTDREMDVIAAILKKRYEMSKSIFDEKLLDQVVLSKEVKVFYRNELNLSVQHFNCVMKRLKDEKVIDGNNQINRKIIPRIDSNIDSFQLLLNFELHASSDRS